MMFARAFATRVARPKKLEPYTLALQLKQLAADGNVDAAAARLRSVPRDAQNVPAWNTMLSLCMAHKKFQLAYALFTDMKRRGFSPNASTFVTMFKGLSQISVWKDHPRQLANAHALYRYYLEHTQAVKHHTPGDIAQLSLAPLVIYINVLGAAGDVQRMFDVYFAMDHDGPHAPDRFVFTAMLRAISRHQERTGVMSVRDSAASDARHVWLHVEKTMQKHPDFRLDSRLVAAAIHALASGRPSDQSLALDIVARHLDLTGHDRPASSPLLNRWTLDAALQLCFAMQKPRLCVDFMHQTMRDLDSAPRSLVTRSHVHKLLRAHAMLPSPHESVEAIDALEWCLKHDAKHDLPELRPDMQTYHLLLTTCLRAGDWEGTVKSFQSMTGIQTDSFHESDGKPSFRVQKRPTGRSFTPNAATMSFVLRAALQTNDDANNLLALRLSEHVGIDDLFRDDTVEPSFRSAFASALSRVVDRLLSDSKIGHDRERLLALKARAKLAAHTLRNNLQSGKDVEDRAVSLDRTKRDG